MLYIGAMMAIQIKMSKYCKGVTGADNCFEIGDRAKITDNNEIVIIDSRLMEHEDAPNGNKGKLVYEVIFKDGSRFAVSAYKLEPILTDNEIKQLEEIYENKTNKRN